MKRLSAQAAARATPRWWSRDPPVLTEWLRRRVPTSELEFDASLESRSDGPTRHRRPPVQATVLDLVQLYTFT